MANKRISELTELLTANVTANDLLYVYNAYESKRINAVNIKNYVLDNGKITGSITTAQVANTASYVDGSAMTVLSASFGTSASYAYRSYLTAQAYTASYIEGTYVNGTVDSSSVSNTASYIKYIYGNGTVENAQSASYCQTALAATYATGAGSSDFAVSSSHSFSSDTASFLTYNGGYNGTASYAMMVAGTITASFLTYTAGRSSGTSSYSLSSSIAATSLSAITSSYLHYTAGLDNGTASYALVATNADIATLTYTANTCLYTASYASSSISSSYSYTASNCLLTASYALTSSRCTQTASYALVAGSIQDFSYYKIYGPYNADAQTSTEAYINNFVVNSDDRTPRKTIVQAFGDVRIPVVTAETSTGSISLFIDYTDPADTWSLNVDLGTATNYITGASLSGHTRQPFALLGTHNITGSWHKFRVITAGGTLIDSRPVRFLIFTAADTFTKTTYPPY